MSGNDFVDFPLLDQTLVTPTIAATFIPTLDIPVGGQDIRDGLRFADILAEFNPVSNNSQLGSSVTSTTTQKYRMRGYRVATSQYEYWVTTDPTSSPPSGNTLVAIVVEARLPLSV